MGYRRPTYLLKFEDPQFEGLEVRCRPVNTGIVHKLIQLSKMEEAKTSEEVDEQLGQLAETFGAALVGWNYEREDGTPVPATVDGFKEADFPMQMGVVGAYLDVALNVSAPLGQTSNGGKPLVEESLPMEPLSESPANS